MNRKYFLGIDTSNYTTSVAVTDESAKVIANIQQVLPVKHGERGLRQSEALFHHVQNLPSLIEQVSNIVPDFSRNLSAIAVTTRPRPLADSYMPVFLGGLSIAKSIAAIKELDLYLLSHQENHLWAGIANAKGPSSSKFLAVHLSGGTSEILDVRLTKDYRFKIDILGGTTDLHAGQFIDRVGVAMGLNFPAGPELEQLALASTEKLTIPSYHKAGKISYAGPESAALRMLGADHLHSDIAKAVLLNVGRSTVKLIKWAVEETKTTEVLLVGGVIANSLIKDLLREKFPKLKLYFAEPSYSRDNAVGAAIYCGLSHQGENYSSNFLS